MTEAIKNFFLETVGEELCVLFCSAIPIIECRGSIPMGVLFGLPWWQTALFSIAGNLLPVPFILLFIRAVLRWMHRCKVRAFNRIAAWLDRKIEKHKGQIEKYSYWGVMIFVGVPLPGTGAWTGTMISAVLGLDWKKSFLAAIGGVLMASVIMLLASYGIKAIF